MKFKFLLPLISVIIFLQGCNSDSDPVKGQYESGAFIVNEGGFGSGNGSETFYDPASGIIEQTIFKNVNSVFAGDVLQSLSFNGDKGYLVLNGSNKIEIVDNNTFRHLNTFTAPALDKPRYLQVIDGKAYISVWGSYDANYSLIDSYILVADTETLQVIDTVDTDEGVENLLYNGKYLFASNYNFGKSHTLAIINPVNNTLIDQIELSGGPAGMVLDYKKNVWVITTGASKDNKGRIFCVNPTTFEIEKEIALNANPETDLCTSPDGKDLIYRIGNVVYKMSVDAEEAPTEELINATAVISPYSLGVDPKSGEIYFGDALDYISPGKVYVYKEDGELKTTLDVGVSPSQIVFK